MNLMMMISFLFRSHERIFKSEKSSLELLFKILFSFGKNVFKSELNSLFLASIINSAIEQHLINIITNT